MTDDECVVYFDNEYFIISLYTLLRELKFGNYRFNTSSYSEIREFTRAWYNRSENEPTGDTAIMQFKANTQQSADPVAARHWIIMNEFWKTEPDITELDSQRTFTHAQRVAIFLRDDRMCSDCLEEELAALNGTEDESVARDRARVAWSDWDADHIVNYADGGQTTLENGQVRCQQHNRADNVISGD